MFSSSILLYTQLKLTLKVVRLDISMWNIIMIKIMMVEVVVLGETRK